MSSETQKKEVRMGKVMFEERTFERKQEVEVRAARGGGVNSWVKARVESTTSKGAHVTIEKSGRCTHVGWRDIRHIGDTSKDEPEVTNVAAPARPMFSNPVLSKDAADKLKGAVPASQPMATVTPIRAEKQESPESIVENSQRLVNVSKLKKSIAPKVTTNPLLAGLLVNARRLENLTQQDVAELLDTSQVTISRFEREELVPDDDMLIAYSEKLGMDIDLLLLARDKPEEAKDYKPRAVVAVPPPAPPIPLPPPVQLAMKTETVPVITPPKEAPVVTLAMDDFFDFCDRMEAICPQPTDPSLRKQWRELTKSLFELRSKI
jgi:transcriptional regulator with XRE-family HTH domain